MKSISAYNAIIRKFSFIQVVFCLLGTFKVSFLADEYFLELRKWHPLAIIYSLILLISSYLVEGNRGVKRLWKYNKFCFSVPKQFCCNEIADNMRLYNTIHYTYLVKYVVLIHIIYKL